MNYNINDITAYFENYRPFEGKFTEDDVDDFVSYIDVKVEFTYNTGASKFVIVPEDTDYVIKVPFTGYNEEEWEDDEEIDCSFHDWRYVSFTGADSEYGDNYLEAEVNAYAKAKEYGYEKLFLPVKRVFDWDGIPVYIQAKAVIELEADKDTEEKCSSKESREKFYSINNPLEKKKYGLHKFPVAWVASLADTLGSFEAVQDFINFLDRTNLDRDLHHANIGYANGHAVIIDYSGFNC